MLTTLDARDVRLVGELMTTLADCEDGERLRLRAGEILLDLFRADHFASYVWDPAAGVFDSRVFINMDPANLDTYAAYFQFRDPITLALKRHGRAAHVNEVMDQQSLEATEFFNDFLARDGLRFGMNYHGHVDLEHVGDLRIWRRRGRPNFERTDVALLDLIGPAFARAMRSARLLANHRREADRAARIGAAADRHGLTPRERDVAFALVAGGTDTQIARTCGIGVPTLRTHLSHMFAKTGTGSRAALIAALL